MMGRLRQRLRREDGSAPVELVASAALLVLPVVMIVASLPTWMEASAMGRTVATEVARIAAIAVTGHGRAENMGAVIAELDGRQAGVVTDVAQPVYANGHVSVKVTVEFPAIRLPFIDVGVGNLTRTITHVEAVDVYRRSE